MAPGNGSSCGNCRFFMSFAPDPLVIAFKRLIRMGKERGYITYSELNRALPSDQMTSVHIEHLTKMGVNVIESGESEEPAAESAQVEEESPHISGYCRRYPPLKGDSRVVEDFSWCGEWQPSGKPASGWGPEGAGSGGS